MKGDENNLGGAPAAIPEQPASGDAPAATQDAQPTTPAATEVASATTPDAPASQPPAATPPPADAPAATPAAATPPAAPAAPTADEVENRDGLRVGEVPAKAPEPKPVVKGLGEAVSVRIIPEGGQDFDHTFQKSDEPIGGMIGRALAKQGINFEMLRSSGKVVVAVGGEPIDLDKSSIELNIGDGAVIDVLTEG